MRIRRHGSTCKILLDPYVQEEPLMDVEEALLEMKMFEELDMKGAGKTGKNGNKN